MKVLLNSFHLNGHIYTLGFHPQTVQTVSLLHRLHSRFSEGLPGSLNHIVQHNKLYHMKVLLNSFLLNSQT